jgi:hypothetical protein
MRHHGKSLISVNSSMYNCISKFQVVQREYYCQKYVLRFKLIYKDRHQMEQFLSLFIGESGLGALAFAWTVLSATIGGIFIL